MAILHGEAPVLYVLGRFEIRAGERVVVDRSWNRHHARALLKALAVAPVHALSRDAVYDIIAPGVTRPAAANALYKALHYIRHACTEAGVEDIVLLASQSVALAPSLVVDADVFRDDADRALRDGAPDACDAALLRYGGDLLPDDTEATWVATPREDLRGKHHALLLASGRAHAEAGSPNLAIARLEALATADPANEAGQIALMEQYAAAGWRDRALRQYEQCREALDRLHATPPSAALERARDAIRAGMTPSSAPTPPPSAAGVPARIIGRTSEVALIGAAIDQCVAGRGSVVLISGDPGAGKTRLAEEAERLGDDAGMRVLWGRCFETDGAPVYWPWLQVLRRFILRAGAAPALDAMGERASIIAQVSPDARALLGSPPAVAPLDPEQARFRLFDAITGTLVRAAASRPLLLMLDDIHTADPASLLLLRFLARALEHAPIVVIATYRDAEAATNADVATAIADITQKGQVTSLALAGLSEQQVATFVAEATGVVPAGKAVAALASRTDGNPLFLREMLRWLGTDAASLLERPGAPDIPVPGTVRDVVAQRLQSLTPACAETLAIAAVIGRDFRIELLRDCGVDDPMRMLAEAEAARIVAPSPAGQGRFRFAHALIREATYARLSPAERAALHGRVGEAIEASSHGNRDNHLPELAHHFCEAAAGGGRAARAVEYARRSAERSAGLLAWEGAVADYRRALDAFAMLPEREPSERGGLLLALGDACKAAGDAAGARRAFIAASEAARAAGDAEMLARAALGYEGAGVTTGTVDTDLERLLREALAALPDDDSALRSRVLGRLAMAVYWSEGTGDRDTLSRSAMTMARRIGDPVALAYALKARHFVLGNGQPEERLGISTEIVRMAQRVGDLELEFAGHGTRLMDFLDIGDIHGVDAELADIDAQAAALGQPIHHWARLVRQAMRAMFAGRFAEGERLAQQALATGLRSRDPNVMAYFGVQMITLRTAQGRLSELEAPTKDFIARFPAVGAWRAVLAHIYMMTERIPEAAAIFDDLARDDFAALPNDWTWSGAAALCTLVASRLKDAPRAAVLYDQLTPYAGRSIVVAAGVTCWGAVSLYLGILANVMGRRDDSIRHLEAAIEMNGRMESRPWVAIASAELARTLSQGSEGERRSAGLLARTALDEARLMGMPSLAQRSGAVVAELGSQRED